MPWEDILAKSMHSLLEEKAGRWDSDENGKVEEAQDPYCMLSPQDFSSALEPGFYMEPPNADTDIDLLDFESPSKKARTTTMNSRQSIYPAEFWKVILQVLMNVMTVRYLSFRDFTRFIALAGDGNLRFDLLRE